MQMRKSERLFQSVCNALILLQKPPQFTVSPIPVKKAPRIGGATVSV